MNDAVTHIKNAMREVSRAAAHVNGERADRLHRLYGELAALWISLRPKENGE